MAWMEEKIQETDVRIHSLVRQNKILLAMVEKFGIGMKEVGEGYSTTNS